MFWYEQDVVDAEKRRAAWSGDPAPVVFYGSSSFRLWTDYAAAMAPWPVLNLGFGGSTIAACAWFFDRLIVPAPSRALMVYAGDNDLGDGRHPQEVVNQFQLLALRWREERRGQPIFFVSIKPSPARRHLLASILYTNEQVEAWCARRPDCHYVEVTQPLLRAGRPTMEYYEDDGLHMNGRGYAVWAPRLKQALAEVLADGRPLRPGGTA